MLEVEDLTHVTGDYFTYKDIGKVSPGAKTKKFEVTNSITGELAGHIKWYTLWHQYAFYPLLNCVLNVKMMEEMITFCNIVTKQRRQQWKPRPKEYYRRVFQKTLKFDVV